MPIEDATRWLVLKPDWPDSDKLSRKIPIEWVFETIRDELHHFTSTLLTIISNNEFKTISNVNELIKIATKEFQNGNLKFDENGDIKFALVEVNKIKKSSTLVQKMKDDWFSNIQILKTWLQIRTWTFKDWFGDRQEWIWKCSQIIDENGEPRLMYRMQHTSNNVHIKRKNWRYGCYVTEDLDLLKKYNYTDGESFYCLFINSRNHQIKKFDSFLQNRLEIARLHSIDEESYNAYRFQWVDSIEVIYPDHPKLWKYQEIVVLTEHGIKSATDNSWVFNISDSNICE